MADWTTQDPNTLLPGEPWTSAKALAAFENPPAIAAGASGAPRVAVKALSVSHGTAGVSGLDWGSGVVVDWNAKLVIAAPADAGTVKLQFSGDGATWPASVTLSEKLGPSTGTIETSGSISVDFATGAYNLTTTYQGTTGNPGAASGTIGSMPATPTHVRLLISTGAGYTATGGILALVNGGAASS